MSRVDGVRATMPAPARGSASVRATGVILAWAAIELVLHLGWEIAQLPLYTIAGDPDRAYVVRAVLHCTAGDGLIALAAYAVAAVALRDARWPLHHGLRGVFFATVTALAYTAFSEWNNVYVEGNWAYREAMPRLLGIGLAPLAQWLLLPSAGVWLLRRFFGTARVRRAGSAPCGNGRKLDGRNCGHDVG